VTPTQTYPTKQIPEPAPPRRPRPSWVHVALVAAIGFLVGVVVALAAGAGRDNTKTVTVTRAPAPAKTQAQPQTQTGPPPTVITKVRVPDYSNVRLDVAKDQIHGQGWHVSVKGGGLFGVVIDSHWTVVAQKPAAGTFLQRGGTITVDVVK
jgi:hypothetical protein